VEWEFTAEVIEWRGPAPFYYAPMPEEDAADLKEEARGLIYWGQIAVTVTIGRTRFATAVFPRDGTYLVPLKVAVRRAERIEVGDVVSVRLLLGTESRPATL
jgi:hypothetical protein